MIGMATYVEKPPKALWLSAVLVVALAAASFATWKAVTTPSTPAAVLPVLLVVLALAAYFVSAVYFMEYRIGPAQLEVVYPPFVFRVERRHIRSVRLMQAPWWMGVGVKVLGRRVAFTTRHGEIVDVEKDSGVFRHVWLSPADPEGFARRLRK